jgi:hypothetical protein
MRPRSTTRAEPASCQERGHHREAAPGRRVEAMGPLYREQHQRLIHSLESSLARYWPELTEHLELSSATLVAILTRVGGPHDVAAAIEQSRRLLHGMSHGLMSQETIEAVLESASLVRREDQTRRRPPGTRGDRADAQACAGAVLQRLVGRRWRVSLVAPIGDVVELNEEATHSTGRG